MQSYRESFTDVIFNGLECVLVWINVLERFTGGTTPTMVYRLTRGIGQDVDGHRWLLCLVMLHIVSLAKIKILTFREYIKWTMNDTVFYDMSVL